MTWLRRLCCALRGHDPLYAIDARGPHVKCGSCDYESPGFNL